MKEILKQNLQELADFFKSMGEQIEKLIQVIENLEVPQIMLDTRRLTHLLDQMKSVVDSQTAQKLLKKGKNAKILDSPASTASESPKKEKKRTVKKVTAIQTVYEVIKKSSNGVDKKTLKEKTNFTDKQISNYVYKLSKQGKIKNISRGVYAKS